MEPRTEHDTHEMVKRPPIVAVLGHVDHGKTTLLDTIRKTNVAAREAGGITQSIGAYEIEYPTSNLQPPTSRKITFIDTPGHEAFTKMRSRGAMAADLAILVVALDDGVRPQTKEAIKILKDTETPFVVALNKVDRAQSEVERVKSELAEAGVLLEGRGGSVSAEEISAKTGQGVPELLDLVLLTAEVEGLTWDPKKPGEGFILEAKLDPRRGMVATGIVRDGVLREGDPITAGAATGKVRQLLDAAGKPLKEVRPSSPVLITGWAALPEVGETFRAGTAAAAGAVTAAKAPPQPKAAAAKKDETAVTLILKADVAGSLEALSQVVAQLKLPADTCLKVVNQSVGEVTDGDVQLAVATHAIIIAFRTRITKAAETLSRSQHVRVIASDVVYELAQALEREIGGKTEVLPAADLEILAIFGPPKGKQQVVGGEVKAGTLRVNTSFEIVRQGSAAGAGRIINLQAAKKDVPAVEAGTQCGLLVERDAEVRVGDHLIIK